MRCNNTTKNAIIAENNIEVIVVLGNIAYICSEALHKSQNLLREIVILIQTLQTRNLRIKAFRISTLLNSKADALSRLPHLLIEWELPMKIFKEITHLRGPVQIDLTASSSNYKVETSISPYPDPIAIGHNALAWDWNLWHQIYIFPPKWLIPLVITKLQTYKGHGLIILPWYPAEPWFPYILNRCTKHWNLTLSDPMRNGRPALEKWTAFNF